MAATANSQFDFNHYEDLVSERIEDQPKIIKLFREYNTLEDQRNRFNFGGKTVMLLGASGCGKSTLANCLFNNQVTHKHMSYPYPVSDDPTSQTSDSTTFGYDSLTIVDTPGFNDTGGTQKVIDAMFHITNTLYSGVDCIVIVLKKGKITPEVVNVLHIIKSLLGQESQGRLNIIFVTTYCDNEDPVEYIAEDKENTLVYKYTCSNKIPDESRDVVRYFCDHAEAIIECTFTHSRQPKRDIQPARDRQKSLDMVRNNIARQIGKVNFIAPGNIWEALVQVAKNYFSLHLSTDGLKGMFAARYKVSIEALREQSDIAADVVEHGVGALVYAVPLLPSIILSLLGLN